MRFPFESVSKNTFLTRLGGLLELAVVKLGIKAAALALAREQQIEPFKLYAPDTDVKVI